jgi:uncharacterized membrane protein
MDKMNTSKRIKRMAGVALLTALAVVLQLIANYIKFGPVNITLALIPIVVGAIIYGPGSGALIGGVVGAIIITAPDTQTFLSFNALATILLCILKTSIAGLVAGYLFKILNRFNFTVSVIVSTLIVPIINSGIFFLGCVLFFFPLFGNDTTQVINTVIGIIITTNFLIEFSINLILSPTIIFLLKILDRKYNFELNIKNK